MNAERKRRLTVGATTLLAVATGACTSWRAETRPLPAPLDGRTLPQIRVFTKSRETIEVYQARLVADSIIGFSQPPRDPNAARVAIATQDVVEVSYLASDGWKTLYSTVGILAIAAAALTLLVVLACASAY